MIAWKGKNGVKSVGLVVDQRQLLSEPRKGGIPPKPPAFVDVSHGRMAVTEMTSESGIKAGNVPRRRAEQVGFLCFCYFSYSRRLGFSQEALI
ncbi:hypothetical protein [Bradyrhizobium sp. 6(2017)]|uniref:hypothetical protein n=1 Tax=Bradyrhizobium sp. 6(2017) TaxID=1197460 RepID=UPI001FEEEC99|nr:hypothetical protein [Bradyrhizobium sp. 6(2017)]